MFILSLLAIKLYRSFLAFFVRFWKQMQCIVSQPLPFLVLQNAYLVAKIQIYIGLEDNTYENFKKKNLIHKYKVSNEKDLDFFDGDAQHRFFYRL